MDDQSGKINSAIDDLDWSWADLPPIVEPLIAGVAVAAGTDALSELDLFDAAMLKRMTARATDYAAERARPSSSACGSSTASWSRTRTPPGRSPKRPGR
jgi:hypothetical protein